MARSAPPARVTDAEEPLVVVAAGLAEGPPELDLEAAAPRVAVFCGRPVCVCTYFDRGKGETTHDGGGGGDGAGRRTALDLWPRNRFSRAIEGVQSIKRSESLQ